MTAKIEKYEVICCFTCLYFFISPCSQKTTIQADKCSHMDWACCGLILHYNPIYIGVEDYYTSTADDEFD